MTTVSRSAPARKGDRLLKTREVCDLFRCSRATIQRKLKNDPAFPRPVPALQNNNHFWESDCFAYLERQKSAAA